MLDEYRSCPEFETEHQLTAEPLRIDLLIIKKKPEIIIKKNIGAIFRQVNVIEFKSPDDYISVDDFYKAELRNDGLLLSVYGGSPGSGNGPVTDPGVERLSS
ncbi:MAG: hypothetical protein LBD08_06475 [Treponema sp.]|nr:hypothetical protein [Treponema sp.]